ncbi:DNA cytosine methyltransferase [Paenibacillus sp. Leaf72]|uniref:DNA cytosine methyltransferase n=1 Tax=Paenibacillus sp. Leaf72 TaxID=1736234 RepID=UPI0007C79852|nr:DNA cytosine methyltransferase [Paenibacillus sp. Leaf72]
MQFIEQQPKLSCCSFFSGAGCLDLGFKEEFEIIWANEINASAAACYMHNVADHILVEDIEKIPPWQIPSCDVYIGGPPCIDFSSNGKGDGETGETGKLVWDYQNKIKYNRPKAFVFENVLGLSNRHKHTLDRMIQGYESCGYKVTTCVLDAAHYGVAQSRKRLFVVGIRDDLGFKYEFPSGDSGSKSVRDAISDLPLPTKVDEIENVPNHIATWTSPTPERLLDVIATSRNQWRGMRRLVWDKLSPTITSHISKDGREHLHPEENRRLTVRECLRLMGVEDSFVIPNRIKLSQQYRMVGNAVAVPVARAIAQSLNIQLKGGYKNPEKVEYK